MSASPLLRLMMLLSPSFPVGGFAYSSGLEQATADGLVADGKTLEDWLRAAIDGGTLRNDGVLLVCAHRAAHEPAELAQITALASALAGSAERQLETMAQGAAFVAAVKASGLPFPALPDACPYPVAIGAVSGLHNIAAADAAAAFLHAFVSNQIQCAIRLGVTGQNGGVTLLARLEPEIAAQAAELGETTLDDLGSNTVMADIAAMRHEALQSRIFRT